MRRPPYTSQVVGGEADALDLDAPRRGFGEPVQGVITQDVTANYGDLLLVNPTNLPLLKVSLPKGDRRMIGEKVAVKNYSSSTTVITFLPAGGDTIDGGAYWNMAAAWAMGMVLLVEQDKWIWVALS